MTTSTSIPYGLPVRTVGIFGGGQLGRMLAQAALPLGVRCIFLENVMPAPASVLGKVYGSQLLDQFIGQSDVCSLEFENTPLEEAARAEAQKPFFPPRQALATAQNRLLEKNLFAELDIPTPRNLAVNSAQDLVNAMDTLGLPLVLKTATGGYDGKGQAVLREPHDADTAWKALGPAVPLIAEAFVPFQREVSIIAVRNQAGQIKTWPLAENHHFHGILSHSIVPAPDSAALHPVAHDYISRLLTRLDYVGVLTLELFVTAGGELIANEMAPRVHNSGHWSIEGATCSQFENHMRAVAGLPLGDTALVRPSVMINIIGQHPDVPKLLALEGVHVHLYDKTEREGRKLGHITVMPANPADIPARVAAIAALLPNPLALAGFTASQPQATVVSGATG